MALTSASTFAEVRAAYDDNLDYDLVASVTKAKDFIQAARFLLRRLTMEMTHGQSTVRDDPKKISGELAKAEAWWRANDATASGAAAGAGRVRHYDTRDFRR